MLISIAYIEHYFVKISDKNLLKYLRLQTNWSMCVYMYQAIIHTIAHQP